jgi:hypothetical protein
MAQMAQMAAYGFLPEDAMPRCRHSCMGLEGGKALAGALTALTGLQTLDLGYGSCDIVCRTCADLASVAKNRYAAA